MITLQFTTIVHTAGGVSLHIFQSVLHAHKMSSEYIYGFHIVKQYSSIGRTNDL